MKFNRLIPTLAISLVSAVSMLATDSPVGTGPYMNVAEGSPLSKRNRAVRLMADQSIQSMMAGNARAVSGKTKFSSEAGVGQHPQAKSVMALVTTTPEMVPVVGEVFDAQPGSLAAIGVSFSTPSADDASRIKEAIEQSKAPVVVVMGHVTPEFESYINGEATPPAGPVADAVRRAKASSNNPSTQMDRLVDEMVLSFISQVSMIDSTLAGKVSSGTVAVSGARYNNLSGQVHFIVAPPVVAPARYFAGDSGINHPDLIVSPSS